MICLPGGGPLNCSGEGMIALERVSKSFDGGVSFAVRQVTLEVPEHSFLAVVGPQPTRAAERRGARPRCRDQCAPLMSGEVDVITAFSSDGRIAADHMTVLGDPLHAILPCDAVLLLSPRQIGRASCGETV